jgi:hypothetical protein
MKVQFLHLIQKVETSLYETEALKGRSAGFCTTVITLVFAIITILTFGLISLSQLQ